MQSIQTLIFEIRAGLRVYRRIGGASLVAMAVLYIVSQELSRL